MICNLVILDTHSLVFGRAGIIIVDSQTNSNSFVLQNCFHIHSENKGLKMKVLIICDNNKSFLNIQDIHACQQRRATTRRLLLSMAMPRMSIPFESLLPSLFKKY